MRFFAWIVMVGLLAPEPNFAEEADNARGKRNATVDGVLDLTIDYGAVIGETTHPAPPPAPRIDLDGPFVSNPGENSATRDRKRAVRDADAESGGDPYLLNRR